MERRDLYEDCTLCPRECHVNRLCGERGYCRESQELVVARAALHMWEEPCISGEKGSGTVFFSGCSLGCIFCQNREIASGKRGKKISAKRLGEIFVELEEKGAANINLVTGEHYIPSILDALDAARKMGLSIPVVYNSSGYEKVETVRLLEGYVDVYLPDFKYQDPALANAFSGAEDYGVRAEKALEEMVRQVPQTVFDQDGYLLKGVIVRHLVLPGHGKDSKAVLKYLHETYGEKIFISIMNQYTPLYQTPYPELNRKVTKREYERVLQYAVELGIENGFIQEGATASESFIPAFDCEGV